MRKNTATVAAQLALLHEAEDLVTRFVKIPLTTAQLNNLVKARTHAARFVSSFEAK